MFKVGDKVMYVGNSSWLKDISKSCIGWIVDINTENTWITVYFPDIDVSLKEYECWKTKKWELILLKRESDKIFKAIKRIAKNDV